MSGPNGLSTGFGGSNIGAAQFIESPCPPPSPPEVTGPRAGIDQAVPATTFDSAKIGDAGVFASLSNGNLTATGIAGTSGDFGNVGATASKSSGKVTYSFTFDSFVTGQETAFGFSDAAFAWAAIVQFSGSAHVVSWRVYGDGSTAAQFWNAGTFTDLTTINGGGWSGAIGGAGHEHQILIDIDNLLVYLAIDGSPVFGMNPAAGTGGISIAISAPFTPGLSHGDANVATLRPTPAYVPTGFSTWDSASAGTTYNDNLAESAAAAATLTNAETFASADTESSAAVDSTSSTQTFVNTLAESAAASDSLTGGLLLSGSVNETAAAADALANAVTWGPAQTESAAANDSLASSATFGSALGESAASADSLAAGNVIAVTRAESAAAADSEAAAQTYVSSLTETAASADALSAGLVITKSLNETAAAADSATVAVTFNPPLAESAAAGDAEASSQVMPNALGEGAAAGDAEASKETFNVSLSESSGAGDSVSAGATTYNENISAAAAAGDTEAAAATMAAAESESAAAVAAEAASSILAGAVGEQATASDQASSTQAASAALGETSGASDSATAGATYGVTVNENLAALASLGVGLVLPVSVGETAAAGDTETARADLAGSLDEQATANDDYETSVVAVITHQMAVLEAVKALVQAALPDMALGFTADSDKKVRAGQREIGQARGAVEIEYEFGSNAQIFRQPIGIVLTARGGFGGIALDDMDAAIGAAILADRTLGGLVDWLEASAATIASRSARGVASLNWATIVITAEYRTEGALAA